MEAASDKTRRVLKEVSNLALQQQKETLIETNRSGLE